MSATWKTVRLFISSTFRDMHAERDHLVKVVFPRLREWCEKRRLHLVDIDLRWGVTKEEADNGMAIEICLREIDGSRPFFLCLLGSRYGWVPDELPPEEMYRIRGLQAETHLSITHLEILHAALQPVPTSDGRTEPICKQAFFYFRDPACLPEPNSLTSLTAEQQNEYSRVFFESLAGDVDRQAMLDDLKTELRRRYAADNRIFDYSGAWDSEVTNPEDDKLVGRFFKLQALGRRVAADVQRGIEEQYQEHLAALNDEQDPLLYERSLHEAFIMERTQLHFPRAKLEQQVSQYIQSNTTSPLVISGSPGSGKSAMLAHWVRENIDLGTWTGRWDGKTFVIARFIGASPSSTSLQQLLTNLCQELVERFELQEDDDEKSAEGEGTHTSPAMEIPTDAAELIQKWPKFLRSAAKHGSVVIVLDAINQLDESPNARQVPWIPPQLPDGLKIVLSVLARDLHSQKESERSPRRRADWLQILRQNGLASLDEGTLIPVPELDDTARRGIVQRLPSVFCKRLDAQQIDQLLENKATYNPLFLLVALEELRCFGSFEKLSQRVAKLPHCDEAGGIEGALDAMFAQVLDRLEWETNRQIPELVPTLFRMLASAQVGLSERELVALIARHIAGADIELRNGMIQIVLRQLRRYLMRKGTEQGAVVDFYHRSFWKGVRAKYLPDNESRYQAHCQLAEFFESLNWRDRNESGANVATEVVGKEAVNLRKVTELPAQLFNVCYEAKAAGLEAELQAAYQRVTDLVIDLEYIEAKARAQQAFALLSDYEKLLNLLPDGERDVRLHRQQDKRFRAHTKTLLAYSNGTEEFFPIACVDLWSDAKNQAESRKLRASSEHLVKTRAFAQFVSLEAWGFEKYVDKIPGIVFQQAYNASQDSPVSEAAGTKRNGMKDGKLLLRPSAHRPTFEPIPTEVRTMQGHVDTVRTLATVPQRMLILSGSGSKGRRRGQDIRVWDIRSGHCQHTLNGHTANVFSVAVSISGETAVSGGGDGTIRIWDPLNGHLRETLLQGAENVVRVDITPNGLYAVSGDSEGTIIWWNLKTMGEIARFRCPEGGVCGLNIDATGKRIVACSEDGSIFRWNLEGGDQSPEIKEAPGRILCSKATPDVSVAVFGTKDGRLITWNIDENAHEQLFGGVESEILSVDVTPDGSRALTGHFDGTVEYWNLKKKTVSKHIERGHAADGLFCVALLPDGSLAFGGCGDRTVRVWDLERGRSIKSQKIHSRSVRTMCSSPNGDEIYTASRDGSIGFWDILAESCRKRIDVPDTTQSKEGRTDALSISPPSAQFGQRGIDVTPDGRRVVSGGSGAMVHVWDVATGEGLSSLSGHEDKIESVRLGPAGRTAVSGCKDGVIKVWDLADEKCLTTLRGHQGRAFDIDISPDGALAVSAGWDRTIRIWDLQASQCLEVIDWNTDDINGIRFTPDGRGFVAGSWGHCIAHWDLRSGRLVSEIGGKLQHVHRLDITPDGRKVISAHGDHTVRVWDLETGRLLSVYKDVFGITEVAYSVKHGIVVAATDVGTICTLEYPSVCNSTPIVTAVRIWKYGDNGKSIGWDDSITGYCPRCANRFCVPDTVLQKIRFLHDKSRLSEKDSPCLKLNQQFWEQQELMSECPSCMAEVLFNPFVAQSLAMR